MDDQQQLITGLSKLYDNLKKEPISRRTAEFRDMYNDKRQAIWDEIEVNHCELMTSEPPPPEGYSQKYDVAKALNSKFSERLKSWAVKKSQGPQSQESRQKVPDDSTDTSKDEASATLGDTVSSSTLEKILFMLAENQSKKTFEREMRPKEIDLEPFDGDIRLYRTFKVMFERSVENSKWDPIQLFSYLKSKLRGDAADAIEGFEVTSESYCLAWEMLDSMFSNRRKLLESVIGKMIDGKLKVQYSDAKSMSQYIKAFQDVLVNVKQLKCTAEEIIVEAFLPKLDNKTRGRFEDFLGHTTDTPSAQQLSEFLHREKGCLVEIYTINFKG